MRRPLVRSAHDREPIAWWALFLTPMIVAALFLACLAAMPYVIRRLPSWPAWFAWSAWPDWAVAALASMIASAICVRVALPYKVARSTVAASLGTIIVMLLCYAVLAYTVDKAEDLASAWPVLLWISSPFLGHCGLAIVFRRDSHTSTLVLAGTLFSGCVIFAATLIYISSHVRDYYEGDVPVEDLRPVLLLVGIPILQWAFIIVLAFVAFLTHLMRISRKGRHGELLE